MARTRSAMKSAAGAQRTIAAPTTSSDSPKRPAGVRLRTQLCNLDEGERLSEVMGTPLYRELVGQVDVSDVEQAEDGDAEAPER
jgi:hypothetical protein